MSTISNEEFLRLVEKYKDEFYRFVYRSVWNQSDIDDVFSEAVMVAWQKRESFEPGTNFRAWFYKILLNKSYVANRHTKRYAVDYDSLADMNVEETGEEEEQPKVFASKEDFMDQIDDDLYNGLNGLRMPEKNCLLLRAADGCSYKEIAEIMDIPVGTVMTHLARGRAKIRKHLARQQSQHAGELAPCLA